MISTRVRGSNDDLEHGAHPPQEFEPPLPKALEEQLGLHLERAKVPVEYLVVDHYEVAPPD